MRLIKIVPFFQGVSKLNKIQEPPYKYSFLMSLPEYEYARYLAKIYEYRTDKKLPLRFCWNIFKISSRSALLCRQQLKQTKDAEHARL